MGPNRLPLYLYAHDGAPRSARGCSRRCPARSRIRRPAAPQHRSPRCCCRSGGYRTALRIGQGVEMGRPSLLLCTARRARRRHPRQRRRRLRAGAERRGLALVGVNDEARAREMDDDVADPLVAAHDRDAVGRQADQRAGHRHLAGVVRRDADLLAGLQAARDRWASTLPARASRPWRHPARRPRSSRWACRCRTPSCAPTSRRSWAAGRAATACARRPCGPAGTTPDCRARNRPGWARRPAGTAGRRAASARRATSWA